MEYKYKAIPDRTRLSSQLRSYYKFDIAAIEEASGKREGLNVLDLGCAFGELTKSRFDGRKFNKVIGVDLNKSAIAEANERTAEWEKYRFYALDLESDFLPKLNEIMAENGINKFDLVFGALIFHHLAEPKTPINALKSVLAPGGKLIIRTSDDGGKMCHPHGELLSEILSRYNRIVTTTDRYFGRKLIGLLTESGYRNIKMLYHVSDTCNKSEATKKNMFDIGFGFRLKAVDAMIDQSSSAQLKSEREWLRKSLDRLKEAFEQPDFWYCNTSYIAIAEV